MLCDSLKKPWLLNGQTIEVSSSLGVAVYPKDGDSVPIILSNADKALYKAKLKGKSRVEFYKDELEK
jgi:diguanylate cyclase (GGDEF)-like protein